MVFKRQTRANIVNIHIVLSIAFVDIAFENLIDRHIPCCRFKQEKRKVKFSFGVTLFLLNEKFELRKVHSSHDILICVSVKPNIVRSSESTFTVPSTVAIEIISGREELTSKLPIFGSSPNPLSKAQNKYTNDVDCGNSFKKTLNKNGRQINDIHK